jgi:RecB family endonuclease NucS
MPVEMGLWRVDDRPVRLPGGMPTEARLEELIEAEPTILGEPLLIIGRQVATSSGKVIDLLAADADGVLHVLELKKDKTPAR